MLRSGRMMASGSLVKDWRSTTVSLNVIRAVSPPSAATRLEKRIPLPPSLLMAGSELELVSTATTSEMGYAVYSRCIGWGTLLS
jgi:hypothetical protein